MSLQTEIAELEVRLTELRDALGKGYHVEDTDYDEYYIQCDHEVIRDADGYLAGIVVNREIMKKYFGDMQ